MTGGKSTLKKEGTEGKSTSYAGAPPKPPSAMEDVRARMLRLMKLLYFLNGFSAASFGRFSTLFYIDRGLDTHHIGIIEAACPVSSAAGNQLFGFVADCLQRKKLVSLCGESPQHNRY